MPGVNAVESPEAVAVAVAVAAPRTKTSLSASPSPGAAAATKGRGLRRWRRVRRDQERPRESTGGGGKGDAHLLHKPWLTLAAAAAAGAPKGNHDASAAEAESSTASVESRLAPPPAARAGPGLGFSVAGAGNSDSEDRRSSRSWSSTAATAPRAHGHGRASAVLLSPSPREWDSPRRPRAAVSVSTEAAFSPSRSSVESSGLRSSNAVKAQHRQQQLGRCRGGDGSRSSSVVGRSASARLSAAAAGDDESVGNGDNGRTHPAARHWSESNLLLQRAQEALENEIEKIMAIRSDEFDVGDDEWSGSDHLEEPNENLMVRVKHLESRLEEASALVKEKSSTAYELEAIRGQMEPGKTKLLLSQCGLDQLYQERMESEIQCIILTRAYQASATLAEDQMTLYETQKSVSEDYKLLGLKLRHTESRAMVLEEMAEKLQLQCKELSNSSEVLQLRYKAIRVSLFCFVQFLLLFIAMGNYLMRLSPPSTKVLPT